MIRLMKVENKTEYIRQYAIYDQKMKNIRDNYINCLGLGGCAVFFDKLTGGVIIPDYLWNSTVNSTLKAMYEAKDDKGNYMYILPANEGVILRGAATYYYLLANKGMYEQVDMNHIVSWMKAYDTFFDVFLQADMTIESAFDRLSVMGILDGIRDYCLNALNIYIYGIRCCNYSDSFVLLEKKDETLSTILDALRFVYREYAKLMIQKKNIIFKSCQMSEVVKKIRKLIQEWVKKEGITNYNMCLRSYRELDSFWELYITARYFEETDLNIEYALGIMQGGSEVPIVLSTFTKGVREIGFMHLYGSFKERHSENAVKNRRIELEDISGECMLCDENILTGNTMYIASQLLINAGVQVDDYLVVRRLGSNRIYHQLSYDECLDVEYCQDKIVGMLFQSNYSKIKENTNIKGMHYNELFQFDLSKERIYELLYINGCYSEKSRVACYKNIEIALREKIRI